MTLGIGDLESPEETGAGDRFKEMVWDRQVGVLVQGPRAEILLANPKALELLVDAEPRRDLAMRAADIAWWEMDARTGAVQEQNSTGQPVQ